jgi:hypothetical protein
MFFFHVNDLSLNRNSFKGTIFLAVHFSQHDECLVDHKRHSCSQASSTFRELYTFSQQWFKLHVDAEHHRGRIFDKTTAAGRKIQISGQRPLQRAGLTLSGYPQDWEPNLFPLEEWHHSRKLYPSKRQSIRTRF